MIAERRMFAKTIIDSDVFIDMPISARLLYYDLGMRADDDGFVNSPKKIVRMIGASQDDLNVLISKNFIIPFDSGVVVIRHWKLHNYIQKDRYKETTYKQEKSMLSTDENNVYKLMDTTCIHSVSNTDTIGIPNDNKLYTQYSIGKDRLDKDSIGKNSIEDTEYIISDEMNATEYTASDEAVPDEFMNVYFYFLRKYQETFNKPHNQLSASALQKVLKAFQDEDITNEYVDIYFGSDEHKGLIGESDGSIFHFINPTVMDLCRARVAGSCYT